MNSQYKIVSKFLNKWLQYALAPNKAEQDWSSHIASFVHFRISNYCWPDAKELNKEWKEILELHQQYVKIKSDELHREITKRTYNLIDSFNDLHFKVIAPESKGEWSKVTSKRNMMQALGFTSRSKFNTWAEQYGIRQVGGKRESWQIRLDNMNHSDRSKLEKFLA